ncbi:MAG TPA: AsmA family protein, partial [Candidatus Udaeobacter sp.]|nr:AsmA family protein [Candidatus Udaeobacter sp.]
MSNSSNRGRWGRGLLILILLLVVGGVAAWIAIPRLLDINTYRSTIEAEAERRLGRPITVGQMELTAFPQPTAVIHDLTVAGQGLEGQTVLRVPTLRAQARLLPLLTARRLELVGLTLENPEIVLVRGATGPWNWQTMLQPKAAGTGGSAGSSGHWQPERVTITKGTLRIVDEQAEPGRTVSSIVQPLDLDIRPGGAGRPSQVDLDLVLANATERGGLHYAGRIGPFPTPFDVARLPLAGDLATKRFPLRLLLPYVRREDGIRALDGFVSSDLRLALKPGSELQMKGDLALDQVHYELGGAAPRAGRLDFASKVDLTAHGRQDLDLRQLEVTLPDGRLTLAGELRNVANAQGGHVALRVDGQHVNLPALAPLAELAGFELPATPLGAQPFDIAGAIEGQGAGFVMRDLRL